MAALAEEAAHFDPTFAAHIEAGKRLDRHYLTTRDPDALPAPAIAAEVYPREDAEGAVAAVRIVEDVRRGLPLADTE